MLKYCTTSKSDGAFVKRTKPFLAIALCGGALLLDSGPAPAAIVVNSVNHAFRAVMTNTSTAPAAKGLVRGNLHRRGDTDNQTLRIAVPAP